MSIVELLAHIGAENIKFQSLLKSTVTIQKLKRGGSKVSFETDQITPNAVIFASTSTSERVGLVVWFDRAKLPPGMETL